MYYFFWFMVFILNAISLGLLGLKIYFGVFLLLWSVNIVEYIVKMEIK